MIRPSYFFLLLLCATLAAQTAPGPGGHWEGAIKMQVGAVIDIAVDLAAAPDGTLAGTLDTPAQGLHGVPLNNLSADGAAVRFKLGPDRGFEGTVSDDGQSIEGKYMQKGMAGTFHLKRNGEARIETLAKSAAVSPELVGTWEGSMEMNGAKTKVVLGFANLADETAAGTLEFAGMGLRVPMAGIVQRGAVVTFKLPSFSGSFDGSLGARDGELVGTLSAAGVSTQITLTRTGARAN